MTVAGGRQRISVFLLTVTTKMPLQRNGISYAIYPEDVFAPDVVQYYTENYMDGILDAGFELLQATMTADLEKLGATNIRNFGFLD